MYRYLNIQQLKRTKLRNFHQLLLYFVTIIYLNVNKRNTVKILKQTKVNVTKNGTILISLLELNFNFCYEYFNSQTLFKL